MKIHSKVIALFAAVVLLLPVLAFADAITIVGTGSTSEGNPLSASATFDVTGDILTITLRNTALYGAATDGALTPSELLTGIFWSWTSGTPVLTPGSATIAAGSLMQGGSCNPGPCNGSTTNVGGEFRYQAGSFGFAAGAAFGVSSAGYIGGTGNMNGPNLDDPNAVNGMNFGLTPTGFNALNGNGGMDSEPVVRGSVVLTLAGASGLLAANITNVTFTYGTSPDATIPRVPEPTTLTMLFLGASLLAGGARRRRSGRSSPAIR